jgi:hypothetical protein
MTHERELERKAAAIRLRDAKRKRESKRRYVVRLQWRNPDGCRAGGDAWNWRDWRIFASIPILFHTEEEAWDYTRMVDIFKHTGRKASCSVDAITLGRG